ncbi:MAG TPA: hypothetical protein VKV95_20085 [Terriglobia bacterium]|nr:hypothetical protein [Terriglobia bacterium]
MDPSQSLSSALWNDYAALQHKANRSKLDNYSWAIEDQLNYFLESASSASLPNEPELRCKHLQNLARNRAKKHANRDRLLDKYGPAYCVRATPAVALDDLIFRERIRQVRQATSYREWRILSNLAQDTDYQSVARGENIALSALKSKVSRCRSRLKKVLAA